MKLRFPIIAFALAVSGAFAQPAPFPLRINSQAGRAPDTSVFRGSEHRFELRFTDGGTATDYTGYEPFMVWWPDSSATGYVAAAISETSPTGGVALATFTGSNLNYDPGVYVYEAGFRTGDTVRVSRQGSLRINASVVGTGVGLPAYDYPVVWSLYTEYRDTATHGPVRPDGTTITGAEQSDGSIVITATAAEAEVATGETITGDGTAGDPLDVSEAIQNGAAAGATAYQPGNDLNYSWITNPPTLFDGSYTNLTDVPTEFTPEAHTHDYTAITNPPWMTEFTNLFTGPGTTGLVTSTSADTNRFLRGDGLWAEETDPAFTLWLDGDPLDDFLTAETDPLWDAWRTNAPAGSTNAIVAGELVDIGALLGEGGIEDAPDADMYWRTQGAWSNATATIDLAAGALQPGDTIDAETARRLIQSDSNAWVVIEDGAAVLYKVTTIPIEGSEITITAATNDWSGPAIGSVFEWSSGTAWLYDGIWEFVYDDFSGQFQSVHGLDPFFAESDAGLTLDDIPVWLTVTAGGDGDAEFDWLGDGPGTYTNSYPIATELRLESALSKSGSTPYMIDEVVLGGDNEFTIDRDNGNHQAFEATEGVIMLIEPGIEGTADTIHFEMTGMEHLAEYPTNTVTWSQSPPTNNIMSAIFFSSTFSTNWVVTVREIEP